MVLLFCSDIGLEGSGDTYRNNLKGCLYKDAGGPFDPWMQKSNSSNDTSVLACHGNSLKLLTEHQFPTKRCKHGCC